MAPSGVRGALVNMWARASAMNRENVLRLVEPDAEGTLLDLGCHDGAWTLRVAERMGTKRVLGVEYSEAACEAARGRGVDARVGDLNASFPFGDASVDAVHSNQVIEHLHDTDRFLDEVRRVLRPGGYAVISTENLASWTNVWPLFLGWQPFSLTNVSRARGGIGNPLALHAGEHTREASWGHVRVFTLRGLREVVEAHGLRVEKVMGAGYYPLPAALGRVHPNHAHFITVKARKPAETVRHPNP